MTRAEYIHALWLDMGSPPPLDENQRFLDVPVDDPHFPAIQWAAEINIVFGVGGGMLAPDRVITYHEISLIDKRHLDYLSNLPTETQPIITYPIDLFPSAGDITRFGTGIIGHADGDANEARFAIPSGLVIDNDGSLIVFDTFNASIRTIRGGQAETLVTGSGIRDDFGFTAAFHRDGTIENALFGRPSAGVITPDGGLLIADSGNNAIRKISGGTVTTIAGDAEFNHPTGIALDADGNILITDTLNHAVRLLTPDGEMLTLAGIPGEHGYRDGEADQALFLEPTGIAVTPDGDIFIADTGNQVIRKISGGYVTTVAGFITEHDGDYRQGGFADGPADTAQFNFPRGIFYHDGILFIADAGNHAVRMMYGGIVHTLAGNGEPDAFNQPLAVAYHEGLLYVADSLNHTIQIIEVIGG